MDTPTLPTTKPQRVYVQLPANMQHSIDCFNYLHRHGWEAKKFNFYNRRLKWYAKAEEIYSLFRNIK